MSLVTCCSLCKWMPCVPLHFHTKKIVVFCQCTALPSYNGLWEQMDTLKKSIFTEFYWVYWCVCECCTLLIVSVLFHPIPSQIPVLSSHSLFPTHLMTLKKTCSKPSKSPIMDLRVLMLHREVPIWQGQSGCKSQPGSRNRSLTQT